MKRLIAVVLALAFVACWGGFALAAEDDHFIQADDYFISDQSLGTNEWIYVNLAKMVAPPTAETKGEGKFFKVTDGNETWTKHFWKSRIAQPADIRLGSVIICFERGSDEGIYLAPEAKDNSRSGSWFMAKVTDVSDLYKGFVTVSGGYKVSPANLRVLKR